MRRFLPAAVPVLGMLLALALGVPVPPAGADDLPAADTPDPHFMGVDEIRPGMSGVGYTVFSGHQRESFDVTILDVLRQYGPKRDLILAELHGPVVEEAGIIQGMSGSPVYIDGRLIGAVAYGWAFSKRPIAGIQPIAYMVEMMRRPEPEVDDRAALPSSDAALPGLEVTEALRASGRRDLPQGPISPLRVPLLVSGLTSEGISILEEALGPHGMSVVQAAGGAMEPGTSPTAFEPGDPVAVPLVTGDASVAAFGTVTYAEGDRIVAFGHPVFHTGGQRLPLAGGRVVSVLPSQMQSFKFSTAGTPVGYFYSDRTQGAAGRLGEAPSMMPFSIELDGPTGKTTFEYQIVRDRFLTAAMVQSIAASTVASRIYRSGMGTLETDLVVTLADGQEIHHRDVVATMSPPDNVAHAAAAALSTLLANPYADTQVAAVSLRATLSEEVRILGIDRVEIENAVVHPGDDLRLRVVLRPYRGERVIKEVVLRVPETTPPGDVLLKVCDRLSMEAWDRERAPDKYRPRNLGQLVTALQSLPSHDELEVRLYGQGFSLVVAGREMPSLPPSMRHALSTSSVSGSRSLADGVEIATTVVPIDQHVVGCHTLVLEVLAR
jgi:hypothetical protein